MLKDIFNFKGPIILHIVVSIIDVQHIKRALLQFADNEDHDQPGQLHPIWIPSWNPGGNEAYFYSIILAYSVWRFTILKYRRSFVFSKRSKEIDLFQA